MLSFVFFFTLTKNVRSKRKVMTFVLLCFNIMSGVSFETASSEPRSQLEKNQAELLVLNQ